MTGPLSRRTLLQQAIAGVACGATSYLRPARETSASAAMLADRRSANPSRVETLVRLLITTPRDRVIETVYDEVQRGADYLDVLGALLIAGVREVQPRPSVGFKFHTVLATISYQLISDHLPAQDRWLPLCWGLDYFKVAQASDAAEGDWKLPKPSAERVPDDQLATNLVSAMENWDEAAADRAATAVAVQMSPQSAFELFYPLGARDFRSIGHKAIFVMCAQRTLDRIGWQFAEPILRSLAYALLMHEDGNPAKCDAEADRPWRHNQQIVSKFRDDWGQGTVQSTATSELLAVLRNGSSTDASDSLVEWSNRGVAPASLWDAIFCGAAELQLRAPNIVSLHAITTTRAIHHAYLATTNEQTRRLLLLQNAALITMFRDAARQRGRFDDQPIEQLEPVAAAPSAEATVTRILDDLGARRKTAAGRVLGYLQADYPEQSLVQQIYQLVALKGNGAHDFKFTSAILESAAWVSPDWRGRFLACGAMHFCSPDQRDNPLVSRVRRIQG